MKLFTHRVLLHVLFYCIVILVTSRCDKFETAKQQTKQTQPTLNSEELRRLILLDTSFVYPLTLATNDAKLIAIEFDRKDKISHMPRSIKEVLTVNKPDRIVAQQSKKSRQATGGIEDVPEVYVFNFNDNRGYAIISADKRVPGVMGSSRAGSIDSMVNNGLKIFLTRLVPYIQDQRAKVESLRDSLFDSLIVKLGGNTKSLGLNNGREADNIHSCPNQLTSTVISSVITGVNYVSDALIKTTWDQQPPYNNNFGSGSCAYSSACTTTNTNYLAGCVPISEGQVVAHFYAKADPTWRRIVDAGVACNLSASDQALVAKLVRDIFGEYGSSSLGCLGTGAGTPFSQGNHGISPKYGLHNGEFRGYNLTDIMNSLQQGSPLIISGYEHLFCFITCWGYGGGHQWIIDGMKYETTLTTTRVTGYNAFTCAKVDYTYQSSSTVTKLHHNWGWGGYGNDWHPEGVFGYPATNEFNNDVRIIAYISPL